MGKTVKAGQRQRVLISGNKLLGLEQVQSLVVHDASTWQEHLEELYHQAKLSGKPVLHLICQGLLEIALREEPTKREAARVLGMRESTLYNSLRRLREGNLDHIKRWKIDDKGGTKP